MAKRNRHSIEIKKKIVEEYEAGVGTAQALGRKYGVHPANIYQWAKKLTDGSLMGGPTKKEKEQAKEIEYYKKKVAELTRSLDLLKKLQADISQQQRRSGGLRGFKMRLAESSEPAK